jgi:hypothetical protein
MHDIYLCNAFFLLFHIIDGAKVGAGLVVGLAIVELELDLGLYFGLNGLGKALVDKIFMATSWKEASFEIIAFEGRRQCFLDPAQ